jgi:hypothetical protein
MIATTVSAATIVTVVAISDNPTLALSNPHDSTMKGQVRTRASVSQLGPTRFPDGTGGITSLRILNPEAKPVATHIAGELVTIGPGEIVERADLAGTVLIQADDSLVVTARSSDRPAGDALDARHDVQTPGRDLRFSHAEEAAVAQDACSSTIVLSTASMACKFGTSTAAVEAIPGATYAWTAQNASITSGLGTNAVTLAFGAASNASVSVSITAGACVSAGAASITLRDPFQVGSFFADTPSPRLGDRVTLRWSYTTADAPKSQTLTITAPAGASSVVKLPAGDRSYSFVVNSVGAWSALLEASLYGGRRRAVRSSTSTLPPPSPCATDTRKTTFIVGAACDNPEATVSGGGQACTGDRVGIRADFSGTPPFSGQWSDGVTFTADTSFVTRTVAASGSYTLISFEDATCSGSSSGQATVTIKPAPAITTFTVPTSVGAGQSGTINFAYSNGTSFALTSSLKNSFSTCCGSSSTGGSVTYNRDFAEGPDTITLTVTGPCGTASSSRVITDPPPVITNFAAPPTVEWATNGSVSFTLQNTDSWTITTRSTNNGWDSAFDPGDVNYFGDPIQNSGGAPSWTGASTCTPNTNCTPKVTGTVTLTFSPYLPNNDALILTAVGPGGTTTQSVPVKVPGGICKAVQIDSVVPMGGSTTLKVKWLTSDAGTLVPSSSLGNSLMPVSQPVPEGFGTYSVLYTRSVAGDDHVRLLGPGCEVDALIK